MWPSVCECVMYMREHLHALHTYIFCDPVHYNVGVCVQMCACFHSDDPHIHVFLLMRHEDECCHRCNAAKKMMIIKMITGTLFVCGSVQVAALGC